jgi:hypothetical protein
VPIAKEDQEKKLLCWNLNLFPTESCHSDRKMRQ